MVVSLGEWCGATAKEPAADSWKKNIFGMSALKMVSPATFIRACNDVEAIKSRWPSWSKAPVSGTGPKGRGFKSHS